MIGLLLISHGPLAEGLRDSYCFFNDEMEAMEVLCLQEGEDPLCFHHQLAQVCDRLDQGEGLLIMSDIPGGSPANQALILKQEGNHAIHIISGCNLLMVLEAYISRNFMDLETLCAHCVAKGKESIMELKLEEEAEEDDDAEF